MLPQQNHLAGPGKANLLNQQAGDRAGNENAERYLGKEKARRAGHDHEVTVDYPLEPAADRPAVNGAHYHFVVKNQRAGDVLDAVDVSAGLCLGADLAVELFQVIAGTKSPAGATQNDGSHRAIDIGFGQHRVEVTEQLGIDCVQPVGSVEGHCSHAVSCFIQYTFCHQEHSRIMPWVLPWLCGRVAFCNRASATVNRK